MQPKPMPPNEAVARAAANEGFALEAPAALEDGAALLREQGLAGLRAALVADGEPATGLGWRRFWHGYAAQFDDLALARAHWLRAEQSFDAAGDAIGLGLAACGLVQCVSLDNQSYDGFDARAERALNACDVTECTVALRLFIIAARVIVAGTRSDFDGNLTADIDRAFSALSFEVDPNIRLRCATAALSQIGRTLDRTRAADFHLAGESVARLPEVTDYSRALWHAFCVVGRWSEPKGADSVSNDLDAMEILARGDPGRRLLARERMLRALLAIAEDRPGVARQCLEDAHGLLNPAYPRDYAVFHFLSARHALLVGEPETASAHATLSLRQCGEAHAVASEIAPVITTMGTIQTALGRYDEAVAAFTRVVDLERGAQLTIGQLHLHLVNALADLRDGANDEAAAELKVAFTLARSIDHMHFFRSLPEVAARICGAALDLDADATFACKVIAARRLPCPDPGIARWPWPLRVRLLGDMTIERDGAAFKPARKAPKRLIDLIRLIAAWGGRRVDAARVAAALWPDAEGDEARDSLKAMLHRARTLLGADAMQVRDGQISFNESAAWLDTWAFEHVTARVESLLGASGSRAERVEDGELARRALQLLALYRGHFLGEGEVPAWALPMRDRLRARFVRSVELLGQRLERLGRFEAAIHLYRAALEQDNLAEELYQHLIECYLARGELSQALGAYRRCRELLSIVLGLRPSARTEALAARISAR